MKGRVSPMKGKHHSEKTKKKMSKAKTGENHCFYGKKFSKKVKEKMSKAAKKRIERDGHFMKDKHHTKKTKRKISESRKGKYKMSEKNKELLRLRLLGNKNAKGQIPWNKGLKNCFSEEVRKKMSEAAKRRCARQKEEKLKNEKK
jgi:hypothetical protein